MCIKPLVLRADKRSNVLTKYLLISVWSQRGRFWDGRKKESVSLHDAGQLSLDAELFHWWFRQ